MNDIELKILIGMHRNLNAIDRKTARLASEEKLTLGQFSVLEILSSKGDMPIGMVRDGILSSVGTISVIVKNLEERGLIERLPHATDRRVCILHITDEGNEKIKRIIPKNKEAIKEAFAVLDDNDKKELLRTLKKLGGR